MTNALEKFEIYYATLIRGGSSFQLYCRVTFFPRKNGILKTESSRGSKNLMETATLNQRHLVRVTNSLKTAFKLNVTTAMTI